MFFDTDNKVVQLAVGVLCILALLVGAVVWYCIPLPSVAPEYGCGGCIMINRNDDGPTRNRRIAALVASCEVYLPQGLSMDSEFGESHHSNVNLQRQVTTVRKKLLQLGAHSKRGVIYDEQGNRVLFVQVLEFNTPPNATQATQVRKQEQAMAALEAQSFTVIRMWRPTAPYLD
jgi:hypothetical protein